MVETLDQLCQHESLPIVGLNAKMIVMLYYSVVRGQTIYGLNASIDQFLRIPYAEPPIGQLRFAKPVPISTPLQDIIDGSKTKYACIQPINADYERKYGNVPQSEDCLVLNIWSPYRPHNNTQLALKPVMFWIHGGSLTVGSVYQRTAHYMWFNGAVLAANGIVVVTVNYRLGPFGFTYGGADETAPGNAGFYDQLLALKWVRENIHLFGGDKNLVTLFGHSAGSWSVSAHIISPLSRGLFRRAIMQSGALLWDKRRGIVNKLEALSAAKQMATELNCTSDNSDEWLQCLRGVGVDQLRDVTKGHIFPVQEGTEFLPQLAIDAFNDGHFNPDVDIIAGVARRDGSNLAHDSIPYLSGNITMDIFTLLVQGVGAVFHDINVTAVCDYYLSGVDTGSSDALKAAFYEFFGDLLMKCPTYVFARQYARLSHKSRVYFYSQSYQSRNAPLWGCVGPAMDVCHGADQEFVWGVPLLYPNTFTDTDRQFARYVTKMWTDFAKT
ncbi:unnamed protein product, partial [Medioppia subpectinata]